MRSSRGSPRLGTSLQSTPRGGGSTGRRSAGPARLQDRSPHLAFFCRREALRALATATSASRPTSMAWARRTSSSLVSNGYWPISVRYRRTRSSSSRSIRSLAKMCRTFPHRGPRQENILAGHSHSLCNLVALGAYGLQHHCSGRVKIPVREECRGRLPTQSRAGIVKRQPSRPRRPPACGAAKELGLSQPPAPPRRWPFPERRAPELRSPMTPPPHGQRRRGACRARRARPSRRAPPRGRVHLQGA